MNKAKYFYWIDEKRFLILIFVFSVLLKISYGYIFENKFHPAKFDFSPHEVMATNFIQGKGLVYEMEINDNLTINRYYEDELIYPLICAFVYLMTNHSVVAMLFVQILYTSFIPIFIYYLSKSLFDLKVARLSAVLAACSPGIIVYATAKIHSMTFFSLIFCISLWAALRFIKKQNTVNAVLLGIMLGLGVVSRSNFILFIPPLLLYLFLTKHINISNFVKIVLAAIIVLIPLAVRNYAVYNKLVILKPFVSWPTMNPKATGTLYHNDGSPSFTDVNDQLFSEYTQLTDLEYAHIINREVIANIKKDKLKYLTLTLKRFYYFWWFSPDSGKEYPQYYIRLYKPYYAFILLFAIFGIIVLTAHNIRNGFRQNYHWTLLIIFIISITLPHYMCYAEGRHRFALEPLMLIFTSYGLVSCYNRLINYKK